MNNWNDCPVCNLPLLAEGLEAETKTRKRLYCATEHYCVVFFDSWWKDPITYEVGKTTIIYSEHIVCGNYNIDRSIISDGEWYITDEYTYLPSMPVTKLSTPLQVRNLLLIS